MKAKVTQEGVIVPKEFLEGAEEVEIHKEDHKIIVIPIVSHDPILDLGKHPVTCGAPDASESHDKYIYGPTP